MNIKDLHEQREGVWHNLTVTYITISDPMPTKPDQNEFDGEKQLIYFMDEDGDGHEMTVRVPDNAQNLEYIDPRLTGKRAVFKIKYNGEHLTGVLTDKKPGEAKVNGPNWEKIAEGKCRHGYIEAEIRKNGLNSFVDDDGKMQTHKLSLVKQLAKFVMTGTF